MVGTAPAAECRGGGVHDEDEEHRWERGGLVDVAAFERACGEGSPLRWSAPALLSSSLDEVVGWSFSSASSNVTRCLPCEAFACFELIFSTSPSRNATCCLNRSFSAEVLSALRAISSHIVLHVSSSFSCAALLCSR